MNFCPPQPTVTTKTNTRYSEYCLSWLLTLSARHIKSRQQPYRDHLVGMPYLAPDTPLASHRQPHAPSMRFVADTLILAYWRAPPRNESPPPPHTPSALACLSTQALREGLHELYPFMVNVNIVDIWTERAPLLLNMLVGSFQSMAERSPVWKALWELSRFPPARRVSDVSLERESAEARGRTFRDFCSAKGCRSVRIYRLAPCPRQVEERGHGIVELPLRAPVFLTMLLDCSWCRMYVGLISADWS